MADGFSLIQFSIGGVAVAVVSLWAAGHALLTRDNPNSALGWVGVCLLFPPFGAVLYFFLGVNRVQARARRLDRESSYGLGAHRPGPDSTIGDYRSLVAPARLGLAAAGDRLGPWSIQPDNQVVLFETGDAAFEAMLAAIDAAESFVYLTTYIFKSDELGNQFIDALADAVRRGVDVRVLIDGVGAFYGWPQSRPIAGLDAANVPVRLFLPPRLWPPAFRLNLRNHRKMLVIDGKRAFTGGMNIDNAHRFHGGHGISDSHFKLVGPVVGQIETVFLEDWAFVTDQWDPPSAPALASAGTIACRAFENGPARDPGRLSSLIQCAVANAAERVIIASPYFLPDAALMGALEAAALRGVDVRVVLPSVSNLAYVDWASRHSIGPLLNRGVQVFLRPAPFAHTKLLMVDSDYAMVGSPNMDPRSLRLNFEFAVEIYDASSVSSIDDYLERNLAISTPYTLADHRARGVLGRLRDGCCWLASPYL
ncbi:phospholipase D-like domain-containing protein [Salinisphaera orenii]|uniref:phospholipase D-like domain-containing protein n=1 Tax=Salinisphaera orenii TaxID=856731 RepID=UPI000DBE47DA